MSEIRIPITKPEVGAREEERLHAVLVSGWLTQGEEVFTFERRLATYLGARHAVATTSATTALHVALVLRGLGPGDEVIVPSYTHISTANSVRYTGAMPVFVDIRPDTYNIDEGLIEAAITDRTRAIQVVHQLGLPAEMDEITAIAERHGLTIIEDAACALGSEYRGRRVGTLSPLSCFSFHPRKVITTGEGGMITTNDDDLAATARSLISHGETGSDLARHSTAEAFAEEFSLVGFNYRMSNLQGAVGVAQMDRLEGAVAARRRLGHRYSELLADVPGIEPPFEPGHVKHNYQTYMPRITAESVTPLKAVISALREAGIGARTGIPPIHRQPVYRESVHTPLPETDRAAESCLILPLYPQMTDVEQDEVVERLASLLRGET